MSSSPPKEPPLRPADRDHAHYVEASTALFCGRVLGAEVKQHHVGDCFFIASLASFAQRRPGEVEAAIRERGEGTFVVRLFHRDQETGTLVPREVEVDDRIPEVRGHPIYATTVSGHGLWVSLFEKAYAVQRRGYSVLNHGGDPEAAIHALTGRTAHTTWLEHADPDAIWDALEHAIHARQITLASTFTDGEARAMLERKHEARQPTLPPAEREAFSYKPRGLVAAHEYSVWALSGTGKERAVTLRNPWAHHEPERNGEDDGVFSVPLHELMLLFANITVGG
jgi:hypothetical protein